MVRDTLRRLERLWKEAKSYMLPSSWAEGDAIVGWGLAAGRVQVAAPLARGGLARVAGSLESSPPVSSAGFLKARRARFSVSASA